MKAGWQTKSLGELLLKTETVNPAAASDVDFSYIDVSSVSNETYEIEETQRLKGKEAPSRARRLVKAGDVIFATIRPTLRRIARVPAHLDGQVCSTGYFVMRPSHELDGQYLFYSLFTERFMSAMELLQKGASYPAVTDAEVRSQQISYPALQEQRRIVTLLDESFADIATAKANAEKNLQNARDLLNQAIQDDLENAVKKYGTVTLGKVCTFENGDRGKNYPGKQHRVEKGIPFINAGHLTPNGLDFNEMDYISPERFALLGNGKIKPNDVLFCLRGSLGKFSCVGNLAQGAIASSLVILRPSQDLDLNYLLMYLSSRQCNEQIESLKGGAAQPNLGAKDLKQFVIPLPETSVQIEMANRLSGLKEQIDSINKIYTGKLTALDDLKKSLLHQAFSGQL